MLDRVKYSACEELCVGLTEVTSKVALKALLKVLLTLRCPPLNLKHYFSGIDSPIDLKEACKFLYISIEIGFGQFFF